MLDAASIIAEAEAKAGMSDPEPRFRKNFDVLLESLARTGGLAESSHGERCTDSPGYRRESGD